MVVRVDADVLTGNNPTGECHVDGGDAISAETARRLCCDGSVIHLYQNVDGQPVAVSAKTRTVPAAMRRALHARDGTCRFPGCTHRGWLDAHHQHHWTDGGPTNLDNLVLLCSKHHHRCHAMRYETKLLPNGEFHVTKHDGTTLVSAPRDP